MLFFLYNFEDSPRHAKCFRTRSAAVTENSRADEQKKTVPWLVERDKQTRDTYCRGRISHTLLVSILWNKNVVRVCHKNETDWP